MDNAIQPWLLRWLASSNLTDQQLTEIGQKYGVSTESLKRLVADTRYAMNRRME